LRITYVDDHLLSGMLCKVKTALLRENIHVLAILSRADLSTVADSVQVEARTMVGAATTPETESVNILRKSEGRRDCGSCPKVIPDV
jgi:hypothetical protein